MFVKARLTTVAIAAFTAAVALTALQGCAVHRGQETVGEYIDDTTITTKVKAAFAENKSVDMTSISVETLDGTVMLSGFAKSSAEKSQAEALARDVKGVKSVKNSLTIRP